MAAASMYSVYIDVPMLGLPPPTQAMGDVMYDEAMARAED